MGYLQLGLDTSSWSSYLLEVFSYTIWDDHNTWSHQEYLTRLICYTCYFIEGREHCNTHICFCIMFITFMSITHEVIVLETLHFSHTHFYAVPVYMDNFDIILSISHLAAILLFLSHLYQSHSNIFAFC